MSAGSAAPFPPGDPAPGEPATLRGRTIRRLYFYGAGGTLFGIHVVNILFTLLTLGVYYFWAKLRVRRYLLSQTEFEGDRFAFHGTARELLLGWLRAALVFGVPVLILSYGPDLVGAGLAAHAVAGVLIYVLVLVFIPVAVVGARRYRLSRTSWRGIRFSFRGRALEFMRLYLGGVFLSWITLGIFYPFYVARRQAYLVSRSHLGSESFGFDGRGEELFTLYATGGLAVLGAGVVGLASGPILGFVLTVALGLDPGASAAVMGGLGVVLAAAGGLLAWVWWDARHQRYMWDHTTFGSARFRSSVRARPLLRLRVGNLLLLVTTLGFAWPWVTARSLRFAFRYLALEGLLDLGAIQQDAQAATAMGEELAGFLDAGFDLG